MDHHIHILAMLADLGKVERDLLRRHNIRLRVDKLTPDGCNAICSATQIRPRFLRCAMPAVEGVETCHKALSSLHNIGLSPLIGWLPRERCGQFIKIDPQDPFMITKALYKAGLEHFLLPAEEGSSTKVKEGSTTPVLRLVHNG